MNELQVFNFGNSALRTIEVNGDTWFVGKDVADALGYGDPQQALKKNVDSEDKLTRLVDGLGQSRQMTVISESGLYSLVLSSKLPTAKKFKRWVTSEVLPTIRKKGTYQAQEMIEQFQRQQTAQVLQVAKAKDELKTCEESIQLCHKLIKIYHTSYLENRRNYYETKKTLAKWEEHAQNVRKVLDHRLNELTTAKLEQIMGQTAGEFLEETLDALET